MEINGCCIARLKTRQWLYISKVEVFRTNVADETTAAHITSVLSRRLPGARISFDLEDCDRVLRVEGYTGIIPTVIGLIQEQRYFCEVLE